MLCRQTILAAPRPSKETYKVITEKNKLNPKLGPFMTNKCAKEYSLKSPAGEVFFIRNLAYFVRHNTEQFEEIYRDAAVTQIIIRSALIRLTPWHKPSAKLKSWHGWSWYDDSVGHIPMRRVILSLGSNIEPRLTWIDKAVEALSALPDIRDVRCSPLYETAPDNVPEMFSNLPFLNGIVTLETRMDPLRLLKVTQAIEKTLGRMHGGVHGAPRTIDIDIIAIEGVRVARPELTVPHPRALTRRFVLQPLADLLPDFHFPDHTQSVSEILAQMPEPSL